MTTTNQDALLADLSLHALLYLNFKIMNETRYVTVERRDKILVEYLKPCLTKKRYKPIKNKVKSLILVKGKRGAMEDNLTELAKHSLESVRLADRSTSEDTVLTDNPVSHFYTLLKSAEDAGYMNLIRDYGDMVAKDTFYILPDDILSSFTESGDEMLTPVTVHITPRDQGDAIKSISGDKFSLKVIDCPASPTQISISIDFAGCV